MQDYLEIGKIVNTHGIRGEVKVIPLTDDPHRYDILKWAFVVEKDALIKYDIGSVKYLKNFVILKLKGVDDPDAARGLKDHIIAVDREHAVKLKKDQFFICDILDCEVFDEKGISLGVVRDVLHTGSNDVYVVSGSKGKEILIPALKTVVKEVSIENKRIQVTLPKGLVEDEI